MAELKGVPAAYFAGGANSFTDSRYLPDAQYVMGENVVCRGGVVQTRPGYRTVFNMPCGWVQGMTTFTPTGGVPHLVFAVGGFVYASPAPFDSYFRIPNIQFAEDSRFVAWANCTQTVEFNDDGLLIPLDTPRQVLIMQDGRTRAAMWDGSEARHLNPEPSEILDENGDKVAQPGFDETPVGLWMAWAGDRLWVSRGNLVFASDYGNPLAFIEDDYIANGRAFYMPEDVTGMVQPTSESPLIVFGESTTTFLQANIRQREPKVEIPSGTTFPVLLSAGWLDTPDFQKTEFGVGCSSHRSIVKAYGETWWYDRNGVINLNAARQFFNDSSRKYLDSQMAWSKGSISPDKSGIASATFENYILMSMPSGSYHNRHSWVLDLSEQDVAQPVWNGWWTGIRPVEWGTLVFQGQQRVFALSYDADGVGRIWEAFTEKRDDNGTAITAGFLTKEHAPNGQLYAQFRYAELYLDEVGGSVDLAVDVRTTRGSVRRILTKRVEATMQPVRYDEQYSFNSKFFGSRTQSRRVRSQEPAVVTSDGCSSCGVESDKPVLIDIAFQLWIYWSGRLGVRGYNLYTNAADQYNDFRGACETDETAPRTVNVDGCGALEYSVDTDSVTTYEGTAYYEAECPEGFPGSSTSSYQIATSQISQLDADKKAAQYAQQEAIANLDCEAVSFLVVDTEGTPLITELGEGIET